MDLKLRGQVAIVTGAGQGIGEEIALSLSKESAIVAVVDVDIELANNISSASATLYRILKKLEIPDPVYNYGQALRHPRLFR
jgi:NAD(P)-dependent dehydrogenase (short-subunit alcohol dehydrogenase family)